MPSLQGSRTETNLKQAFAGEAQATQRYEFFARQADVEGHPDAAAMFRAIAQGESAHALGHLDILKQVCDPVTGQPIGDTATNLKCAIAGETFTFADMYPAMAQTAREEGFGEIAEWLETLAKAEESHEARFQEILRRVEADAV